MATTYRDAGVDIDEGDRLVDLIKPLARPTMRPEVLAGIGRVRRALRPRREEVPRPGAGLGHRRGGHQAQAGVPHRPARHGGHRPGRHVGERRGGHRRRAPLLPRLLRHREAASRGGRTGGHGHRRGLPPGGLRADRRRDRRAAGLLRRRASTTWPGSRSGSSSGTAILDGRAVRPGDALLGRRLHRPALERLLAGAQGAARAPRPAPTRPPELSGRTVGRGAPRAHPHLRQGHPRAPRAGPGAARSGPHHRRRTAGQRCPATSPTGPAR